jgi:hypothetical protein
VFDDGPYVLCRSSLMLTARNSYGSERVRVCDRCFVARFAAAVPEASASAGNGSAAPAPSSTEGPDSLASLDGGSEEPEES